MIISSSSTIVTIDGVDFSIPAGYEENPDEKLYDESEFGRMDCKMYKDNQNNSILIGVMELIIYCGQMNFHLMVMILLMEKKVNILPQVCLIMYLFILKMEKVLLLVLMINQWYLK